MTVLFWRHFYLSIYIYIYIHIHTLNALSEWRFHDLTNYNVENEFTSVIRGAINLLNNEKFEKLIKENNIDGLLDPRKLNSCQYYDENQFIWENREDRVYLNIHSLPRHGRELVGFWNLLKTKFDILILTEIGAKNKSMIEQLLPDYALHYAIPDKDKCGRVG